MQYITNGLIYICSSVSPRVHVLPPITQELNLPTTQVCSFLSKHPLLHFWPTTLHYIACLPTVPHTYMYLHVHPVQTLNKHDLLEDLIVYNVTHATFEATNEQWALAQRPTVKSPEQPLFITFFWNRCLWSGNCIKLYSLLDGDETIPKLQTLVSSSDLHTSLVPTQCIVPTGGW